ncbi:MAG: hypothetical protein OEV44_07480, partial [Spirochaetota bacterium]|nr:hypothetical protein [Spirochaetota bacterium]
MGLHKNIASYGGDMDSLIYFITYFVVGWFVVSFCVMLFFALRYRRREGSIAKYIKGEGWKYTKWILIPVVLVTISDGIIDVANASVWHKIKGPILALDGSNQEIKDENGKITQDTLKYQEKINKWKFPDGVTLDKDKVELVKITASQFQFTFEYAGPDGKFGTDDDYETYNVMHVPTDKRIIVYLTAKDVVHSFWIKNLRLKQDMIPGRWIKQWFEIPKNLVEKGSTKIDWAKDISVEEISTDTLLGVAQNNDARKTILKKREEIINSQRVYELACAE